jgi:hypothetical protein
MSFGTCSITGKTFAEKFPASVYEAFPAPSPVTSEVQFQRAMEIEAAYIPTDEPKAKLWKEGSKRYLYFMLNPSPDGNCDNEGFCKGGFYMCPADVKFCCFNQSCYPADFRWFVVDPTVKEEVEYMATQMDDFWFDGQKDCAEEWWFAPLFSHGLSPTQREIFEMD